MGEKLYSCRCACVFIRARARAIENMPKRWGVTIMHAAGALAMLRLLLQVSKAEGSSATRACTLYFPPPGHDDWPCSALPAGRSFLRRASYLAACTVSVWFPDSHRAGPAVRLTSIGIYTQKFESHRPPQSLLAWFPWWLCLIRRLVGIDRN